MAKHLFGNKVLLSLGLAAGALLVQTTALAQPPREDYKQFEITPFIGYMGGGEFEDPVDNSGRDLDSDTTFGVIFDAAADYWRHYEVLYSSQSTQLRGATPTDMDVQYLQVGGIVSHPDAERFIPYFGMTVGAARLSPDGPGLDDETKLAFSVGTGVRVPITEHIGVRFDARAFVTLLETDGDLFCVSAQGAATCRIRAKSDTLFQYSAGLGLIVAF